MTLLPTILPVLARELRSESRHAITYWMRVIAAASVLPLFFMVMADPRRPNGADLLAAVNTVLFGAIWIMVPLATADCVSRERRGGTLGLLFLTPLTSLGILLAKTCAHALRSFGLILATVPVASIALLVGGVSPGQIMRALLVNLSALVLALSVSVAASVFAVGALRAVTVALVAALVCSVCFVFAYAYASIPARFLAPAGIHMAFGLAYGTTAVGEDLVYQMFATRPVISSLPPPVAVLAFALSCLASCALLLVAARCLGKSWQTRSEMPHRSPLPIPPFARGRIRHRTNRLFDKSPVLWLFRYSAPSRAPAWIVPIAVLLSWLFCVGSGGLATSSVVVYPGAVLLFALSVVSSSGFRREKESGWLETLLATRLRPREIVLAKLRLLYLQFAPGVFLWAALGMLGMLFWLLISDSAEPLAEWLFPAVVGLMGLALLPVLGLHCSLAFRSFFGAWLGTCAIFLLVGLLPLVPLLASLIAGLGLWFCFWLLLAAALARAAFNRFAADLSHSILFRP